MTKKSLAVWGIDLGDYLGYKFVVKSYYLENAFVWGSKIQTKQMVHPDFGIRYMIENRCEVKRLFFHCSDDLVAVMIKEGIHSGRVAFARKCDLKKVFQ